ncbi:MAG: hypothetical protein V4568_06425 [Pseudomonadota bacterium]
MSILQGAKRAAKFSFWSMPLSMLGYGQLKAGNQHIRDLWRSLSAPACPECCKGVLHRHAESTSDSEALYPWECSNVECGFSIFASVDVNSVREIARARSAERTRQRLAFIDDPARNKLIRGHSLESRFWYACASFLAAWFIYLIASGAPFGACVTSLSFAFATTILAITKSYRAWQVETGSIFLPESPFWFWLKYERWVR